MRRTSSPLRAQLDAVDSATTVMHAARPISAIRSRVRAAPQLAYALLERVLRHYATRPHRAQQLLACDEDIGAAEQLLEYRRGPRPQRAGLSIDGQQAAPRVELRVSEGVAGSHGPSI